MSMFVCVSACMHVHARACHLAEINQHVALKLRSATFRTGVYSIPTLVRMNGGVYVYVCACASARACAHMYKMLCGINHTHTTGGERRPGWSERKCLVLKGKA